MPVDIVLPQIGPWTQGAWTSLLMNASNAIFDRFVAQDSNVALNGEPIARDAYRELLSLAIDGNNPCKNPEDVNYFEVIKVFGNIYDFVKAGVVALVYNATCIPGISSIHLSVDRIAAECRYSMFPPGFRGCLISELSQPPPDIYIYPPDERRVVGINHVLPIPTFNNLNASKLRD